MPGENIHVTRVTRQRTCQEPMLVRVEWRVVSSPRRGRSEVVSIVAKVARGLGARRLDRMAIVVNGTNRGLVIPLCLYKCTHISYEKTGSGRAGDTKCVFAEALIVGCEGR